MSRYNISNETTNEAMVEDIFEMQARWITRDVGLGHLPVEALLRISAERAAMRQVFCGMGSTCGRLYS